jgi:pimeloyl-ACP methyl ester carboxylesterase
MSTKRRTRTVPSRRVAHLDWDQLERMLSRSDRRGPDGPRGMERALREYFGDEELAHLRHVARQSHLIRSRRGLLGNVVFLPGITGSDLAVVERGGDGDEVWVNFARLVLGRIDRLRLDADGATEANRTCRVIASGINKMYYARAILHLRARWNVVDFPYDWRKDVDHAADALAEVVGKQFKGEPVHLVAHSMGGLVARTFVRRHPRRWEAMKDAELVRGGRLIMLGTPNAGSFAIPQVLTGEDEMMGLLAKLDIRHDLAELVEITNTFVGSYLMLPAPSKLPAPLQSLYRADLWGANGRVAQRHLDRAYHFHQQLEEPSTIDPTRMVYIAGCRRPTLAGLTVVSPGEFDYELTTDGDGRVPHALGLLPGVPTYYVDEVHGDLARNDTVLAAIDELLEHGRTSVLATQALRGIDRAAPTMRDYRSTADKKLMEDLDRLAEAARQIAGARSGKDRDRLIEARIAAEFSAAEARFAEDAIVKAALGSGPHSSPRRGGTPERRRAEPPKCSLEVTLVQGDIAAVKAPLVVVGHYKGVPPIRAVGALDEKLNGWITRVSNLGMIGGNLGETFFVPNVGKRLAAGGAILAGMGEFGKFTGDDLLLLMSNVTVGVSALGMGRFASVLIGSGEGNVPRETALRRFLEGIGEGVYRFVQEGGDARYAIRRVTLVERSEPVFHQLAELLDHLEQDDSLRRVRITVRKSAAGGPRRATRRRRAGAVRTRSRPATGDGRQMKEVRLTVEHAGDRLRFSALADTAVVPVREVSVSGGFAAAAADRLMQSGTGEEQEQFGRLLYTYLVPEEFHRLIDSGQPLKLILDRSTAGYPWEMARFRSASSPRRYASFGSDLQVARQFRTLLSGAPGLRPPLNRSLKVLVIADPAPDKDLQLPGARLEGREVANVLRGFHRKNGLSVEVIERIGPAECDSVEILALLLSGDFDIVHYAGHGDFDKDTPARSGWIFGRDWRLTATEIFRARRVPRLVFANACFSAVTAGGEALSVEEMSRALAGVAQAFFERGVENYIGTGWPVEDTLATTLATTFYRMLLEGKSIGESLQAGRRAIDGVGSTWGAYQHYGSAHDVVIGPV